MSDKSRLQVDLFIDKKGTPKPAMQPSGTRKTGYPLHVLKDKIFYRGYKKFCCRKEILTQLVSPILRGTSRRREAGQSWEKDSPPMSSKFPDHTTLKPKDNEKP
ncbi:hypothetical protein TNIN_170911 [Trichonephila inaurata madagascariensis]|uniref:Uncharacterized protein n=1 Tax=Trichonephila inaurata madagascariensis TaxID=2747483 RepID=A0A8X7C8U6_9ARAC|nr:hypothetical protein TNIN_170911 [Trichonephila inaurata madagascariensis]